jgi:hypothetical protein
LGVSIGRSEWPPEMPQERCSLGVMWSFGWTTTSPLGKHTSATL